MKSVLDTLEERISVAMGAVAGGEDCAAIVKPAKDPKFGDYQANGVMAMAKKLKTNPRKLAEEVVKNLDLGDICEPPEVAGPGFINLRLKAEFLADRLLEINKPSADLGIAKTAEPKTIVVDFSSPNIAKQMHVGHLRSTIIGDSICRTLEALGHKVIRQNHIGDWGTQFGRVVLGLWHLCMAKRHGSKPYYVDELERLKASAEDSDQLKDLCLAIRNRHEEDWREDFVSELGDGKKIFEPFLDSLDRSKIGDLWEQLLLAYQYVSILEDSATGMGLTIPTLQAGAIPYETVSRHTTAMLQKRGNENRQEYQAWEHAKEITLDHCDGMYQTLGVTLKREHERGESTYNDILPDVVAKLTEKGHAVESDGAMCVFPEGFKNKQGDPLPFIIQKSDGAYLYATTDLAALRYRVDELKADAIIYVTDSRQKLHFEMLFAVAKMAGWARDDLELSHVMFGSVLGEDGAPLKTRSGENVKLKELDRQGSWYRRRQVRRLLQQSNERLCLQLRQDARDGRQYRAVYAVRLCEDKVDRAKGAEQRSGYRGRACGRDNREPSRAIGVGSGQTSDPLRRGDPIGRG